ncbi:MAG TPA: acylphosphatase [Caulobacteraceae bacterium]|nr:acylphosphatase [Caulobacteraceae bacterium]
MDRIAVRLTIRGRVQGVGYRWWAQREARRLGLDGWVRNRSDGAVELLAAGSSEAVAELADLCRRGPPSARVTAVEPASASATDIPAGFEERPTA